MTITYPNGVAVQALLMARGNDYIRAAVPGDDDVRSFHLVNKSWFSEEGDPVKIEFAWQWRGTADIPAESECVCPKALASHLMSVLLQSSESDDVVEDMLYLLSSEGAAVRIQQSRLYSRRPHAKVVSLGSGDSSLTN